MKDALDILDTVLPDCNMAKLTSICWHSKVFLMGVAVVQMLRL